jgi:hypothetical protein
MKYSYSIPEVAELTSFGETKIKQAIRSGRLVARKFDGRTAILSDDLQAFLNGLPPAGDRPTGEPVRKSDVRP